jgi:hypothetical protein
MFNDFFAAKRTTRSKRQRWVRTRRLSLRGVRSRGVRRRGVRSRGVRWRGVRSRGVSSRGVRSRGIRSRGVRSRGVRSRREVQLQLSQLPLPVQHQGRAQRPCPHAPIRYARYVPVSQAFSIFLKGRNFLRQSTVFSRFFLNSHFGKKPGYSRANLHVNPLFSRKSYVCVFTLKNNKNFLSIFFTF